MALTEYHITRQSSIFHVSLLSSQLLLFETSGHTNAYVGCKNLADAAKHLPMLRLEEEIISNTLTTKAGFVIKIVSHPTH